MNWHAIWAIIEKDLKIVLQSKSVTIPLVTVPLLVAVVLPSVLGFVVYSAGLLGQIDVQQLLAVLPATLAEQMAGLTPPQVLDWDGARIDELKVRGRSKRIVVKPKAAPAYEIIPPGTGADISQGARGSNGAVGKRVWPVMSF